MRLQWNKWSPDSKAATTCEVLDIKFTREKEGEREGEGRERKKGEREREREREGGRERERGREREGEGEREREVVQGRVLTWINTVKSTRIVTAVSMLCRSLRSLVSSSVCGLFSSASSEILTRARANATAPRRPL